MSRGLAPVLTALALVFATAWLAGAEPVVRANWVPGNGDLAPAQAKGDVWTFRCPKGGSFDAAVDTHDDTDTGMARIAPRLAAFDGTGAALGAATDGAVCTFPPACGAACPTLGGIACGSGKTHTLTVVDRNETDCTGGGGYTLTVEVFDKNGASLAEKKVKLGGAPKRRLPKWLDPGKTNQAPALNDEVVGF